MVEIWHRQLRIESRQGGYAVVFEATRDDAVKIVKARIDVDRNAVPGDPMAKPYPESRNFDLLPAKGVIDPNPDTPCDGPAANAKGV